MSHMNGNKEVEMIEFFNSAKGSKVIGKKNLENQFQNIKKPFMYGRMNI